MNWGSCHPAELLTTLRVKRNSSLLSSMSTSMSFSWHDSPGSEPTLFAPMPSLLPRNFRHCLQKLGLLQKRSGPNRPRDPLSTAVLSLQEVQLRLQRFGFQTPSSNAHRPWTCQRNSTPPASRSPLQTFSIPHLPQTAHCLNFFS